MISLKNLLKNTALLCTMLTAGVTLAEDGVVRMSDRSAAKSASGIQQASCTTTGPCGETCYIPQPCPSQCCPTQCCPPSYGLCDPCYGGMCDGSSCNMGNCNMGNCNMGSCYTQTDCNSCYSGGNANGMNGGWGNSCDPCQDSCYGGRGRNGRKCRDGRNPSFAEKCKESNNCLCDRLFGWMIPSGNCGQGSPWLGKYHMTYADQPSYIDPRDTQLYAAQGYGMPMSVPLAPNVHHAYNYSSGMPASRITHIGNYNPMTSPRPLKCQSW